ncbi:MAG: fused MFS/spermidine synthase [Phycisphaerae bacterium]|nr:fused MFS/spermidine synthase [Phycisphaerae bacterium]
MGNRLRCRVMGLALSVLAVLSLPVGAYVRDYGRMVVEKQSLYASIFVYERGSIRTLMFGQGMMTPVQSQVDLKAPRRHLLEYSELAFCGLFYQPQPKRLLVLGLGGGVIPREMRYYFPEMEIDVAEIDPEIPPIATKYMGFETDDKLKVHVEDGRVFIKKRLRHNPPQPKYDMVILDAFNGDYIPFHLMTREFLEEVKGVLADDGVVVANVFSSNRLFDAEFRTFVEVFGRAQAYFGEESTNVMLAAPGPAGPLLSMRDAMEKARAVRQDRKITFNLVEVAQRLAPKAEPEADAMVLTDDRAPVNWLREQESGTR